MQRLLMASAVLAAGLITMPSAAIDPILLEQVSVKADDGVSTEGTLYTIASLRPKPVVITMHPNHDRQRHYMLRPAAERGFAGFGMKSR